MKVFALALALGLSIGATSMAQAQSLVCFFAQANYQGGRFCFYPGQKPPDLTAFPLNDGTYTDGNFGSIEVVGGAKAVIYDGTGYQSSVQPMTITSSIPNLSQVWNSTIFSVDVY